MTFMVTFLTIIHRTLLRNLRAHRALRAAAPHLRGPAGLRRVAPHLSFLAGFFLFFFLLARRVMQWHRAALMQWHRSNTASNVSAALDGSA